MRVAHRTRVTTRASGSDRGGSGCRCGCSRCWPDPPRRPARRSAIRSWLRAPAAPRRRSACRVTYTDDSSGRHWAPTWVRVRVHGVTHWMSRSGDRDWSDGVTYRWSGKLPLGHQRRRLRGPQRPRRQRSSLPAGTIVVAEPATPTPDAEADRQADTPSRRPGPRRGRPSGPPAVTPPRRPDPPADGRCCSSGRRPRRRPSPAASSSRRSSARSTASTRRRTAPRRRGSSPWSTTRPAIRQPVAGRDRGGPAGERHGRSDRSADGPATGPRPTDGASRTPPGDRPDGRRPDVLRAAAAACPSSRWRRPW